MGDYSNLTRMLPDIVGRSYELGKPIADETFLHAMEQFDTPLLSGRDAEAVNAMLSGKRGPVPKDYPTREVLAARVAAIIRDGVPQAFLEALSARLRSGQRLRLRDLYPSNPRERYKRDRDMFIRHFYRDFYNLQDGRDFIIHPLAKRVEVPMHIKTRSGRALAMTHRYLDEVLCFYVPSRSRMLNIISGN